MKWLRSTAAAVSKTLGRNSAVIRAGRPVYNRLQDALYVEDGIPTSSLGEPYRVCRSALNFVSLEEDVYRYLKRTIEEGQTILDIGSFIGLYAILEQRLAGKEGRVFAFEPTPTSLHLLYRHLSMNNAASIRVFPCAVGSSCGEVEFFQHTDAFLNSVGRKDIHAKQETSKTRVPIVNVDKICEMFALKPDLMRIDVQGFEAEVLKGASQTLLSNPGLSIILEVHPQLWDFHGLDERKFTKLVKDLGRTLTSPEGGAPNFSPDAHVVIAALR